MLSMILLLIQIWFFISVFLLFMVVINLLRYAFLQHKITSCQSSYRDSKHTHISIIIPVRDEEDTIFACLESIKNVKGEIVVINDGSTDKTLSEIKRFHAKYPEVSILTHSVQKPQGWIGKNYACAMGAKYAKYDTYCFIDADVRANADFLNSCALHMCESKTGFLSIFPKQLCGNLWSHFYSSMLNWFLLAFYPSFFQWMGFRILRIANGQCILIDKKVYGFVNHTHVKNSQIEDIDLAKLAASKSVKRDVVYSENVKCQMYATATEALAGFSRNFRRISGLPPALFRIWLHLYSFFFLAPLALAFFHKPFLIIVLLFVLTWSLVMSTSDKPYMGVFYPVYVCSVFICGILGLQKEKRGEVVWKGRKL